MAKETAHLERALKLSDLFGAPRRRPKTIKIRFCENKGCGVRLRQGNKGKLCSLCKQAKQEEELVKLGSGKQAALHLKQLEEKRASTGRKVICGCPYDLC